MQRREFITLLGGAAAWPLAARAQQPAGRIYRVGCLNIASREQLLHLIKAFEEGLRSLGYRVGENVVIEYRFADGETERLPALGLQGGYNYQTGQIVWGVEGDWQWANQRANTCGAGCLSTTPTPPVSQLQTSIP
jgi:hypothetical protein